MTLRGKYPKHTKTKISAFRMANQAIIASIWPDSLLSLRHGIAFPKVGDLFNVVNKTV